MKKFLKLSVASIMIVMLSSVTKGQTNYLRYKVLVAGSEVGKMSLTRNVSETSTVFLLNFEIRKRMIWLYVVNETEQSEFKASKLVRSELVRKVNGKVKARKQLVLADDRYRMNIDNDVKKLPLSTISNNILMMYFSEPVNTSSVFSENFQTFLAIRKSGSAEYDVIKPDGKKIHYSYENGLCTKVKTEQDLFSVEFVLTNDK